MESFLNSNNTDDTITDLEITPLVAVALVLVMIFMVTAPLFVQPELQIELPRAITGEDEERENITISINQDGLWAINDKKLDFNDIPPYLSAKIDESSDKYVLIRADREAMHKWLVEAMSLAKKCGAKTVSVAVKQKDKSN